MRGALLHFCLAAGLMAAAPATAQVLDFEQLEGWHDDDHAAALATFLVTCDLIDAPDWRPICALAADVPQDDSSARAFFELVFKPVVIGDTIRARLTAKRKIDRNKVDDKGVGQGVVAWDVEVTNQRDEVCATYQLLTINASKNA